MRASFPTAFNAIILGKSREAGSFQADDDRTVSYGEAYELAFESSEGLTQTVRVGLKNLDEAADFDVVKAGPMTAVQVVGDVQVNDSGGYLRLTSVRIPDASDAAKAARRSA